MMNDEVKNNSETFEDRCIDAVKERVEKMNMPLIILLVVFCGLPFIALLTQNHPPH